MEIRRGDIYYVKFENNIGSEQGGQRPVLVIQNDIGNRYSPTTIGVPLTSRAKKEMPTHMRITPNECPGLKCESIALFEQIITFDKSRIVSKVGRVSKSVEKNIYNKISISVLS